MDRPRLRFRAVLRGNAVLGSWGPERQACAAASHARRSAPHVRPGRYPRPTGRHAAPVAARHIGLPWFQGTTAVCELACPLHQQGRTAALPRRISALPRNTRSATAAAVSEPLRLRSYAPPIGGAVLSLLHWGYNMRRPACLLQRVLAGAALIAGATLAAAQEKMTQLEDLVAAYRILAEQGVIDAYGHVSVRSSTNPQRYYLARSLAPERVQVEDILEYDLDSKPIDARGGESVIERFIHGEIYRARPDVRAIVHNHSPSVVPFSVSGVPMRAIWHMAAFVGEGLPNWEIRDVRKGTNMLVSDAVLGASLARTLGTKPAVLMRGHGSVTVGESLPRAVGRSGYLEISARMQMQAMLLSKEGTYLDAAEAQAATVPPDYNP